VVEDDVPIDVEKVDAISYYGSDESDEEEEFFIPVVIPKDDQL